MQKINAAEWLAWHVKKSFREGGGGGVVVVVVILPWKKVNLKQYKMISCILGHV